MNPLEQRVRHLAIADAERHLADLSAVVETLVERYDALLAATRDAVDQLHRSVGQLQADQDARDRSIGSRLRWLVRGR